MAVVSFAGSDDEDGKNLPFLYRYPVQSSEVSSNDENTRQVVGSMGVRNVSAVNDATSDTPLPHSGSATTFLSPEPGSMKSVTRLRASSPISECSESTPLLSNCDSNTKPVHVDAGRHPDHDKAQTNSISLLRRFGCICLTVVLLLVILNAVITTLVFEYRPLNDSESTVVLKNKNDTIIVTQFNSKKTSKVSFQLVSETGQSLHIINLYSTLCSKLTSHNSTVFSSASFTFDSAVKILFPTYLVTGSCIDIANFILNVSEIAVNIDLYIFNNLDVSHDFATNLDKSVFQATIYTKGRGHQNTSTFVNYTIPSTGYYFVVIDSTAVISAQFDITLHKKVYHETDYPLSCTMEGEEVCVLSYNHISFHDKQQCILAHTTYVHDAVWIPPNIQVTTHERRNTATAILVMASVGGLSVLSLTILLLCGFYCLCKCFQHKHHSEYDILT